MDYCVYYDKKTMKILDFFPNDIDFNMKSSIMNAWNAPIMRDILTLLSEQNELTAPMIKDKIGHSMSTLHENIKKLESDKLIKTEMIFKDNKKKVITPIILFATKNPKFKASLKRFFQGMWVNSEKSTLIIEFLKKNPDKYFTPAQISSKVKIPVDDVELLLSNWDSFITRSVSDITKEIPFEKKVHYRYKKNY